MANPNKAKLYANVESEESLRQREIVKSFLETTPEYYPCPENDQKLTDWVEKRFVDNKFEQWHLALAYSALRYTLKKRPETQQLVNGGFSWGNVFSGNNWQDQAYGGIPNINTGGIVDQSQGWSEYQKAIIEAWKKQVSTIIGTTIAGIESGPEKAVEPKVLEEPPKEVSILEIETTRRIKNYDD